jgi:Cft2 family RNA processing exonuclease
MPYAINENAGKFDVINTETQQVKASHDTRPEAERQVQLLESLERGIDEDVK